jgi:hypothetical protein
MQAFSAVPGIVMIIFTLYLVYRNRLDKVPPSPHLGFVLVSCSYNNSIQPYTDTLLFYQLRVLDEMIDGTVQRVVSQLEDGTRKVVNVVEEGAKKVAENVEEGTKRAVEGLEGGTKIVAGNVSQRAVRRHISVTEHNTLCACF